MSRRPTALDLDESSSLRDVRRAIRRLPRERRWSVIPGIWRWIAIGICAYSAVITLFTVRQMLRVYWNAPEAAKKNRQLAAEQT